MEATEEGGHGGRGGHGGGEFRSGGVGDDLAPPRRVKIRTRRDSHWLGRAVGRGQRPDMPEYSIIAADPRDHLAVARLIDRKPDLAVADLTKAQQATWDRMMHTADLAVYLAWHGNDAVGTTTLLVMPHITYACRPTAFIEAVYVRDEHRRRGVARAMIEHALHDAKNAGCHKVQLLTHKRHAQDGAHSLYRALGFNAEAEGFRLYLEPDRHRD